MPKSKKGSKEKQKNDMKHEFNEGKMSSSK